MKEERMIKIESLSKLKEDFKNVRELQIQKKKESYDKVIRPYYDQIPSGFVFKPSAEAKKINRTLVPTISVIRGSFEEGTELQQLFVRVEYIPKPYRESSDYLRGEFKPRTVQFTLFSDGVLSGRVPSDFPGNERRGADQRIKEEIFQEVLRVADEAGIGDHFVLRDSILSQQEESEIEKKGEKSPENQLQGTIDIRRHTIFLKQSDFLFWFSNEKEGMKGYKGYVFPWGIALDNPEYANAVYTIPFEIDLVKERIKEVKKQRSARGEFLKEFGALWSKGKKFAIANGAARFYHPKTKLPDADWEKFIVDKLNKNKIAEARPLQIGK
ncbi:MAG: hypothetical protein HYW78_01395 [Parcubacteria group bacterium]|nr:hypothetical protein [Parcubacteria group bacterium]